ncbi:MAG: DUF4065 domain-containing protein [Mycoplasmataceae bacterium]|nr:DUF4065 domain-containing protein [Mycoplasmataceae bacterium]
MTANEHKTQHLNLIEEIKKYRNHDVSELVIHKILYFTYGFYFKEKKKKLFENPNFEAWSYGPVEVDYRYNNNLGKFKLIISEQELLDFFKKYDSILNCSAFSLVNFSHLTSPWIKNGGGTMINQKMSIIDIDKYFLSKESDELLKIIDK